MPVIWLMVVKNKLIIMNAKVIENIRISIESIKSHIVRTILTVLIIAIGIMALVGILTAIDSIKYFLNENFTMMGANTFTIRNRELVVRIGNNRNQAKRFSPITYDEAMSFKDEFEFPAYTTVYVWATGTATLKYEAEKTNPNTRVLGTDENYLKTSGLEIEEGRNFTQNEVFYGSNVVIIGSQLVNNLFKNKQSPVGKIISIGPGKYKVIGVLKEKGSSIGFSGDRSCLLPLTNVRHYFARPNMTYTINVMTTNPQELEPAIGEATGLFRVIRKDRIGDEDTFGISKSDNIAKMLIDNIGFITWAATIIGIITLFGAAIGLMNIMLVSVTERTREIGIRKAMGATRKTIRNQFLAEAIVIGQLGGVFGIVLGIIIGNVVSMIIGSSFIIPWLWIFLGVALCIIVALLSGFLPATKASKLDPIESLRYE